MKQLLITIILMIAFNVNAQSQKSLLFTKSNVEEVFAMNTIKKKEVSMTQSINLKLKPMYREPVDMKKTGLVVLLGGIAFTTAAILESGDFKIYQGETSRQIMLGVGIGLTITGAGLSLSNK